MSRCFPYPPPGYTLSRASNEALIESIKLQREREKARVEKKKDRKREKKEKRKEKEEKPKWEATNLNHDVHGVLQKLQKEENEQFERSGITEELEPPINSQSPSNSTDNTQNSNKRKRHESPLHGGHNAGGNILRFRLPMQKHVDCKISSIVDELSSTSGRTDSSSKSENAGSRNAQSDKVHPISVLTDSTIRLLPVGPNKELSQSTSQQIGNSQEKHHNHVHKKSKKQHRDAKKYAKLIECTPPRQPNQVVDCDEEWLCRKNLPELDGKVQTYNQMSCASSCMLWPRAQYLRQADIYALPYSIPF